MAEGGHPLTVHVPTFILFFRHPSQGCYTDHDSIRGRYLTVAGRSNQMALPVAGDIVIAKPGSAIGMPASKI
jgi:hypothetical protein